MALSKVITTDSSPLLPIRNTILKAVALSSAAATSVLELFDGLIDTIATYAIINNGTGYAVGDLVTLVAGEFGTNESRAVFRVTQIDNLSPSSSISSSPSSSVSSSPSESTSPSSSASPSTSASESISSSISTSPSSSISSSISQSASGTASDSPSSSISSSPSPSVSPSTSISASPSPSVSPSTSISASPSSSISSSISDSPSSSISSSPSSSISSSVSSSISSSPSPSAGDGEITAVELIKAGGGYTSGNTYATTTDGSGSNATMEATTLVDVGSSIAKLASVANESAPPLTLADGILTTGGISARITGTDAKGHVTYE